MLKDHELARRHSEGEVQKGWMDKVDVSDIVKLRRDFLSANPLMDNRRYKRLQATLGGLFTNSISTYRGGIKH
jgi:hypothetical protein